jgi:hypothetical protein
MRSSVFCTPPAAAAVAAILAAHVRLPTGAALVRPVRLRLGFLANTRQKKGVSGLAGVLAV